MSHLSNGTGSFIIFFFLRKVKQKNNYIMKKKQEGNNDNHLKAEMELKQSLIKTRNAIRKKYQDLHNEKLAIHEESNEIYKPIIEPLKSFIDSSGVKKKSPK